GPDACQLHDRSADRVSARSPSRGDAGRAHLADHLQLCGRRLLDGARPARGLLFSLAFAMQAAFASELAHFGFTQWFASELFDNIVYLAVGIVMAAAGVFAMGRGVLPHLHLPGLLRRDGQSAGQPRELKWWMPAVHGFIAGWGIDAFSMIIYTT